MQMIAKETNNYAWGKIAPHFEAEPGLPPNSPTSVAELYWVIYGSYYVDRDMRQRAH